MRCECVDGEVQNSRPKIVTRLPYANLGLVISQQGGGGSNQLTINRGDIQCRRRWRH